MFDMKFPSFAQFGLAQLRVLYLGPDIYYCQAQSIPARARALLSFLRRPAVRPANQESFKDSS